MSPQLTTLGLSGTWFSRYSKLGVRFYAVDFSGASNQPALMRSLVPIHSRELRSEAQVPFAGRDLLPSRLQRRNEQEVLS